MNDTRVVHRGDVFYAHLVGDGNIQDGTRPVIIVSNELNNKHSPTVNIVPLTSSMRKKPLPVHVAINPNEEPESGLTMHSIALGEQVMIINKTSLREKRGKISSRIMEKIQIVLQIQLGII